jgi:hypothetical protein
MEMESPTDGFAELTLVVRRGAAQKRRRGGSRP